MAKILASLALVFMATLTPVLASLGPIMLGDHVVFVQDWKIKKPQPFFSVGAFGWRRGYYSLCFEDHGRSVELPIYPDELSSWRNDQELFANWKSEKLLCKISDNEGKVPIRVAFSARGNECITIKKIDLMKDLPEQIDVPPDQSGWKYFASGNTTMPSQNEINVNGETFSIFILLFIGLLPTAILLELARNTTKPYFKN